MNGQKRQSPFGFYIGDENKGSFPFSPNFTKVSCNTCTLDPGYLTAMGQQGGPG